MVEVVLRVYNNKLFRDYSSAVVVGGRVEGFPCDVKIDVCLGRSTPLLHTRAMLARLELRLDGDLWAHFSL